MNKVIKPVTKEEVTVLIVSLIGFTALYTLMKISSDIGDYYLPKERFMSDDFWSWKPK
jgi:hypothetical protein